MGFKITDVQATTSVASAKPRASVSLVVPVTDTAFAVPAAAISCIILTYKATPVQPVMDVSYARLSPSAYLDESGRFKLIGDLTAIVDSTAFALAKPATDSFSLTDATTLLAQKGLSDSVSFTETFVRTLIFIRNLADFLSLSDAATRQVSKLLADALTAADTLAKTAQKGVSDSVTMSEAAARAVSKSAGSDAITMSDTSTRKPLKSLTDSSTLADSGYLYAQGYCDLTYFAQDYVGVSRTF